MINTTLPREFIDNSLTCSFVYSDYLKTTKNLPPFLDFKTRDSHSDEALVETLEFTLYKRGGNWHA